MTLDEAIKERLKVIKVQEKLYEESYSDESKEIIKSAIDNDRQLAEWLMELKEAKRLLKSAIDEWHIVCEWGNCGEYCGWFKDGKCTQEWSGEAEALKLIGDESNGI